MAEQSVGQVSMDLVLNSKGFKKQLTNSVNDAVKSAGNSCTSSISSMFGKLGAAAAAAFSVKALFDFGKSAIELGSDLAEVQNVVDVVFGDMSKEVDDFAKTAIKQFGLSQKVAKEYAGVFGAMGTGIGLTKTEALDMSKTLTGLAGDVASFRNISSDEAFTKLKAIFTGETESLKTLGVMMTQTNLDAFALSHGFGKTTKSMTEQEKVMLRYKFVLNALKNDMGDYSRTSDGWANSMRTLSLQWDEFKAQIGQALIQVLAPLIRYLNIILERLVQIGSAFNQFTAKIFGKQELKGANEASQDLSSNIGGIGEATEKTAKEIKKSLMGFDELNTLADNTSVGADLNAGGIDLGLDDINADEGNAELDKTNEKMQNLLNRAKELKDIFKEGFNATFNSTGWEKAVEHSKNIVKTLKELANDKDIQNAGNKFAETFLYNLARVIGSTATIGGNIAGNIQAGLDGALISRKDKIKQTLLDVFNFEEVKSNLIGDFSESLAEISGVLNSDGAIGITQAIDEIAIDAETYAIGIYERISTDLLNCIVSPFTENSGTIKKSIQDFIDSIKPMFDEVSNFTDETSTKMLENYDKNIHPIFDGIKEALSTITARANQFWQEVIVPIFDDLTENVNQFINESLKPLMDAWYDFCNVVSGPVKEILQGLMATFYLVGEVFAMVLGGIVDMLIPIVEFIVQFITDTITGIIKLITDLVDFIIKIINGDFKGAIDSIINIIGDMWNWILKTTLNFVLKISESVENGINTILRHVNSFLGTDFKINFTGVIKDWIDEQSNKFIERKETPKLASGGYVAANTPQLAIIGDNKHEGEIVAPESKIAEAVASGISSVLNGMNLNNQNNSNVNDIVIPIILDGNELDRVVVSAEQRRFARNGGR